MAVSCPSTFLSSSTVLLPSSTCPPPYLRLPQTSLRWSSLVAAAASSPSPLPVTLIAIAYPALAYSTTLYFKSAYNVQIIVADDEPEDKLVNRFRREVLKARVLQECRRRRFFENNQDKKKRKAREAARRNRNRRPQSRAPAKNKHEAPTKKKDDVEDDNWELPDVDLPYC